MTAPEPVFSDPPPSDPTDPWAATAETLRDKTGQNALIFEGGTAEAQRLAERIRAGRGPWAGHRWEAHTRTVVRVYARHVGPAEEDPPPP